MYRQKDRHNIKICGPYTHHAYFHDWSVLLVVKVGSEIRNVLGDSTITRKTGQFRMFQFQHLNRVIGSEIRFGEITRTHPTVRHRALAIAQINRVTGRIGKSRSARSKRIELCTRGHIHEVQILRVGRIRCHVKGKRTKHQHAVTVNSHGALHARLQRVSPFPQNMTIVDIHTGHKPAFRLSKAIHGGTREVPILGCQPSRIRRERYRTRVDVAKASNLAVARLSKRNAPARQALGSEFADPQNLTLILDGFDAQRERTPVFVGHNRSLHAILNRAIRLIDVTDFVKHGRVAEIRVQVREFRLTAGGFGIDRCAIRCTCGRKEVLLVHIVDQFGTPHELQVFALQANNGIDKVVGMWITGRIRTSRGDATIFDVLGDIVRVARTETNELLGERRRVPNGTTRVLVV